MENKIKQLEKLNEELINENNSLRKEIIKLKKEMSQYSIFSQNSEELDIISRRENTGNKHEK